MKLKWNNPVITILSIDKTELGQLPTGTVDDSTIWHGYTYYSFS